ncbi:LysR family transcriptional regulator [Fulvimarina endophytica]|uniref:LysR family transcriptional regulator n=2 Tax=Fulvimarina endophytica TaxID=2293836 RepID=A0A371X5U6_9HYPH|nr:LysR family transcriptional regulator [Fulvimarina endophytica]
MSTFEAVARLGGVSRAAEELGVSPSAVSQQLRLLEEQFGVLLFRREKRRLSLTDDGERLYQTTSQALRMIRDVRSAIVRKREGRRFVMRVSPSFGVRWLGPRLKRFLDTNSGWDLRIDATPDFSRFETEITDIDLRYGPGAWSGLHSEAVLNDLVLPMCSPAYRDELTRISEDPRQQLASARLIDSVKALYRWDFWLTEQGIDTIPSVFPIQLDRSSMAIQLAVDDGGVVLESSTLAIRELVNGDLVPLSPSLPVIEFPAYWIVCPARHRNRRIVANFSNWIREEATEHDRLARNLLTRLGCTFSPPAGMDIA